LFCFAWPRVDAVGSSKSVLLAKPATTMEIYSQVTPDLELTGS